LQGLAISQASFTACPHHGVVNHATIVSGEHGGLAGMGMATQFTQPRSGEGNEAGAELNDPQMHTFAEA
jgi:hypothetical protein